MMGVFFFGLIPIAYCSLFLLLAPDLEIVPGPPSLKPFQPVKCSFLELEVEVRNSQSRKQGNISVSFVEVFFRKAWRTA